MALPFSSVFAASIATTRPQIDRTGEGAGTRILAVSGENAVETAAVTWLVTFRPREGTCPTICASGGEGLMGYRIPCREGDSDTPNYAMTRVLVTILAAAYDLFRALSNVSQHRALTP